MWKMNKEKLLDIQSWVRSELDKSVRFWLDHGMDHEHGGVYTCLDRKGEIYSTDKSVWMQGRCGWIFAFLCHHYGVRQEWLDASKSCLDFMERYCINREAGDRMYFTVTAEGKPLRQRRYYYSEAFYALANAEYYGVTGDKGSEPRRQGPHRPGTQDHPRDPLRTGLRPAHDHPQRHRRTPAGGPGAPGGV